MPKKVHINQIRGENPTSEAACSWGVQLLLDNTGEEQTLDLNLIENYYNVYPFRWAGRHLLEKNERKEFLRRERIYHTEHKARITENPNQATESKSTLRRNVAILFYELYNDIYDWEAAESYIDTEAEQLTTLDKIYEDGDIITRDMVLSTALDTRWPEIAKEILDKDFYELFKQELSQSLTEVTLEVFSQMEDKAEWQRTEHLNNSKIFSKERQALLFLKYYNLQMEEKNKK